MAVTIYASTKFSKEELEEIEKDIEEHGAFIFNGRVYKMDSVQYKLEKEFIEECEKLIIPKICGKI